MSRPSPPPDLPPICRPLVLYPVSLTWQFAANRGAVGKDDIYMDTGMPLMTGICLPLDLLTLKRRHVRHLQPVVPETSYSNTYLTTETAKDTQKDPDPSLSLPSCDVER